MGQTTYMNHLCFKLSALSKRRYQSQWLVMEYIGEHLRPMRSLKRLSDMQEVGFV